MKKLFNKKLFFHIVTFFGVILFLGIIFLSYKSFVGYENINDKDNSDSATEGKTETVTTDPTKVEESKTQEDKTTTSTTTSNANWWEYPKTILPATKSGNDLLVLVNKKYKLTSTYSPTDLVDVKQSKIRTKNNGTYYVRSVIISNLKQMNKAAIKDGVDLSVVSAYRSYSTQKSTYNYWVSYNDGCVSCADKISARAGHSQHQLGTAIDFSTKTIGDALGDNFTNTKAEVWLRNNAYKYGFVISYPKGSEKITGYSYESWHYRYIGVGSALEMKNGNAILELYLRSKN
jgi:D-alanyl-D-alanine carboxypeptidase